MSYYVNRLDNEAFETLFRLFTIADKENTELDVENIKRVEIIRKEGKVSLKGRINYRRFLGDFVYEVNKNITYTLTDFLARGTDHNAAYNAAITGTYRVFMETVFGKGYTEDFLRGEKVMANQIAGVAKLLGVEVGEVFQVGNAESLKSYYLRFSKIGLEFSKSKGDDTWITADSYTLFSLLRGELSIKRLP